MGSKGVHRPVEMEDRDGRSKLVLSREMVQPQVGGLVL